MIFSDEEDELEGKFNKIEFITSLSKDDVKSSESKVVVEE